MAYKVIKDFTDMMTGCRYKAGDKFPADGVEVADSRIAKLASANNRQKMPLIKEVKSESEKIPNSAYPALVSDTPEPKQDTPAVTVKAEKTPAKKATATRGRKTNKN